MSTGKNISIVILIFIMLGCHADENDFLSRKIYNYRDEVTWSFFKNELKKIDFDGNIEVLRYQIIDKGYCHQLVMNDSIKKEEYLMLYHEDFLLLYNEKTQTPIYAGFFGKNAFLYFTPVPSINVDSFLTEGTVIYDSKNLSDISIGKPWVEGKSDDGFGSIIKVRSENLIESIVISNGFFSTKEHLFYNNNRVKKIRISDSSDVAKYMDYVLDDTAKPEEIILEFETKEVNIEIMEVYSGEKFNDTCLNFILVKSRM